MKLTTLGKLGLAAAFAVVTAVSAGSAQAAPDKIKYGNLRVANAVYIGIEKGLFAKRNIEVETIFFRSGAEVVPSLSTGQIDVGATTAGASLYNAMAAGINAKIVADYIVLVPGHGLNAIVVRKDLADSGKIKSAADAKGMRFGITARGQATHLFAGKFMETAGLTDKDVTLVTMSYPDMLAAFKGGSIDLAAFVDPFITIAEGQGFAKRLINMSEIMPNMNLAVIMYGERLVKKDRDLGMRFMAAYAEANDILRETLKTPGGVKEIAAIYQKYLPLKSEGMYERVALGVGREDVLVDIDGPNGLQSQQDWYVARGLIPKVPKLSDVVDNEFATAAQK